MTQCLRILAVDDEPLALDRISDMLTEIGHVDLVGKARNGGEAIGAVQELRPDLLLLDIEMPGLDGFDVVESLMRASASEAFAAPLICFVTAYPQFASDAFDTGALDFLCKPVRLPRLEKAIGRARTALKHREADRRLAELSDQLEELRSARTPQSDAALWVHSRGQMVKVDPQSIEWIASEGEYVRLYAAEGSFLLRSSMTQLCDSLANHGIVRVHRSGAINRHRLRAIRRSRTGARVVLESGIELPVGRKYRSALDEHL